MTVAVTMPEQHRSWQIEALSGMMRRRSAVVVAHRRAGKTEAVCARLILAALEMTREHPAPFFAYIAPFLNQAKAVAWDRLKYYGRKIPRTSINESELSLKFFNGSAIRIFGADYPDRLRGLGFDGVVMDEVAQMRPETWPEVVRPALADRSGWAIFIGTPKGQNIFHELYQKALEDPANWYSGLFRADQTGVLPESEIEDLKHNMGANAYAQEFLCDFTAANTDSFIDFLTVHEAATRPKPIQGEAPLVFGLDPARFGEDRTALIRRRGLNVEHIDMWREADLMQTSARVAAAMVEHRPDAVFVDAVGLGAGVVDRLRQLGHAVIGVNSGARASQPERYYNLKAEMWFEMRGWLMVGGSIPDNRLLREELVAPKYSYDHVGRLRIEAKDDVKERILRSPDLADALALTFAYPMPAVKSKRHDGRLSVFAATRSA